MVTSSHEAMHRIFQKDPGIFTRTFRTLRIPFPETVAVGVLTADLTEIEPLERRLDTLLRMETAEGRAYLLAVESQGRKDPAKHSSWTYYLAHLNAKYGIDPVLLVVCQDEQTALWASRPIRIGPPEWPSLTVRPMVLGPHNVPVVTDPATAARDVPLATFSAITHRKDPNAPAILEALATALKTLDEETAVVFGELTELGLGTGPAAQIWRDLMAVDLSFFRSETSQRLRAEGRAAGRAEAVLMVLERRGVAVSQEIGARVTACTDTDTIDRWLTRAITAATAEDLFTGD
ncbi:hypothetical protein OG909_19555 [Streptomyces sp. NBC_01754]|uniref:hypothetical protein n=1 Tax=Streptomyces sp. NBC_01754 TaxID=2975930 RepID=UPI002DD8A876|nr:hypothetical protein [Streptomyces sp. NBC_01754]WSC94285.1 hypothetical protein OG909_19555 [Streptomyces sp. NBC_01754]